MGHGGGWGVGGWHAGAWHAGGFHYDQAVAEEPSSGVAEAVGEVKEEKADALPDVAGPFEEEPHGEEANSPRPAQHGWDNATSLQAAASLGAASTWGGAFCTAHRVGYFCSGFTRLRCCRRTWGFASCGTTVHSSACGWHGGGWGAGGWHAGAWHAGGFHYDQAVAEEPSSGVAEAVGEVKEEKADTHPDVAGPFEEEPNEEEADSPRPAQHGW